MIKIDNDSVYEVVVEDCMGTELLEKSYLEHLKMHKNIWTIK